MINFGGVPAGSVLPIMFNSYDSNGASVTLTGLAVTDIEVYKGTSMTQRASDAGYTLLDTDGIDIDSTTGLHGFSIDTGDNTDASFYTVGSFFTVVVSAVTVDGQTVSFIAATFRLMAAEAVTGQALVTTNDIAANAITATAIAANAITDTKIASGALTAAKFAANALDAVWSTTTRLLTAGTNIVLAKGTGVTGFNDLSAAQVNAEVDTALTDYDAPTSAELVSEINSVQADIAALNDPTAAAIADAVWDEAIAGHVAAGSTGEALTAAGSAGDPWVTALPGAYGAGSAGFILGNNLDAAVSSRASQTSVDDLPTNAELATSQAAADDATLAAIAALNNPSAATIADAVWDELMSGHLVSGSAGEFQANTPTSAQIVAGLLAAEITELISVPGASPQLEEAIAWIYMAIRNKRDTTATTDEIHNSGGTVIGTATVSDDGTTFTKGKYA